MVDSLIESREATEARLRRVIQQATLDIHDGSYAFEEFASFDFARSVRPDALALVRDDDRWSQLVPSGGDDADAFALWSFHFSPYMDNSASVGWLASRLKNRSGTGVIVVCGHNATRGGLSDYWGCPAAIRDAVTAEVRALCAGTAT